MWQESDLISAEIFTEHHRYIGKVATRGHRLADSLNDPASEVLELRDVHVSQPSNILSQSLICPHLQLRKEAILLTIPTGTYEAPTRRLYNYIEKQHYQAHIMLPGCHLVGVMHLPDRVNRWQLLCEGSTTPSFVPITDVMVQFATRDFEKFHKKVVIFRRQKIESLFISDRPLGPIAVSEKNTELPRLDPTELARELSRLQLVANEPQSRGGPSCQDASGLFKEVS